MNRLRTALCTLLTAAILLVPAVPASASEEDYCGTLPDLSKWGWQWPC